MENAAEVIDWHPKLLANQMRQNQVAHDLPELQIGDVVRVRTKKDARNSDPQKAEVKAKVNIRSYEVETEDGRRFRLNRVHLHSTKVEFDPQKSATVLAGAEESSPTDKTTTNTGKTGSDSEITTKHLPSSANGGKMSNMVTRVGRTVK